MRRIFWLAALVLISVGVQADTFSFIHITDTHITASGKFKENLLAIASEVNAMTPKPAFVVVTGDVTETGSPAEMEQYREAIKAFAMPVYNVPGNHETKWSNLGKNSFMKYFNHDSRYSLSCGGIRFVGLDSSTWLQHHGLIDKSQLEWLKKDLEQVGKTTPVVLFYHHCPGYIPNEAELLRTIKLYNVRLVLVGHGHVFKTWKKNGVFFQETKGSMNDQGGYRILQVTDTEITSVTKLVGKEPVLDATIPISSPANPVALIKPKSGESADGSVTVRAVVSPAEGRKVECGIDNTFQPAASDASGFVDASIPFDGTPGWHTVTVRATDPDGMEWTDSVMVKINAGDREAWRAQVSGGVQGPVLAKDGRLYFGTLGGGVYCLDAKTGKQIWRTEVYSDIIGGLAASNGYVFCGAANGSVMAIDHKSGELRWIYKTAGPVQATPVAADGKVFIGSGEPAFYAIDAVNGKLAWRYAMERTTQVQPIYMKDTLYFGAWDKHFYALNAADGSLRWKTPIGISFYYSTANSDPATDGRRIVANVTPFKPEDPDIYCLDASSGKVLWSQRNPTKSDCGFNSPYAVGDRLYTVTGSGAVFCLNMSDGKEITRFSTGQTTVSGKPVTIEGKTYLTHLRGAVTCADSTTGKTLWTYSTGPGYLFRTATVCDDLLIVPSTDGSVTALRR